MKFEEKESQTVISSAITITNNPNKNGKTANQSSPQELIDYVFSKLKSIYINLPTPTSSIISPEILYENGEYISVDTAFINTSNNKYLPFKNDIIQNMYNLGTHNGKSLYKFTSIESAISNGIILSNIICNKENNITLKKSYSLSDVFRKILLCIFILYIIKKLRNQ